MADVATVVPDVKSESVAVSSPAPVQAPVSSTPATEQVVANQPEIQPSQSVPYGRFKEVIEQKNAYESRLEELEHRLRNQETVTQSTTQQRQVDRHVQKLIAAGMAPELAQLMTEVNRGIAEDLVTERVSPLEQKTVQQEIASWTDNFAKSHKDYAELEPEMYKLYQKLPKHMQTMMGSGPEGLEFLYASVKNAKLEAGQQAAFNQGAQQAYDNKGLKAAVSSTSGAAAVKSEALSGAKIKAMSLTEYKERLPEIKTWLSSQK